MTAQADTPLASSPTCEFDLAPSLRQIWMKGVTALEIRNYDYAVELISNVVRQAPEFLDARRMLRRAEAHRERGQKKGLFSITDRFSLTLKSQKQKDPWTSIQELEENVFQKDPYNVAANQNLHALALRLKLPDLAAFALETVREGHPENTRVLHQLAEYYTTCDESEKAGEVYRQILKADPGDMDAVKGEKNAAAQTSIKARQGASFMDLMKDKQQPLRDEHRSIQGTTPEKMNQMLGQLLDELRGDEHNLSAIKTIASLYLQRNEPEQALAYYQRAVKLSPADMVLQEKAEAVRKQIAGQEVQRMESEIEAHLTAPDVDEKRARLQEFKGQQLAGQIAEATRKVERNPTDKEYRYELATLLYQAEEYRAAIRELQQAKSNPHLRNKALLLLGKCFAQLDMDDLAITAFKEAVLEMVVFNEEKKELLYELGLAYEKMDLPADYLSCMKEIYHQDYDYKDVATRVESSYTRRGTSARNVPH